MDALRFTSALRQKSSFQQAPVSSNVNNGNGLTTGGSEIEASGNTIQLIGGGEDSTIEGQRNGYTHNSTFINNSHSSSQESSSIPRSSYNNMTSSSSQAAFPLGNIFKSFAHHHHPQVNNMNYHYNNGQILNNLNHLNNINHNINNNHSDNNQPDNNKGLTSPLSVVTDTLVKNGSAASHNNYSIIGAPLGTSFGISSPLHLQNNQMTGVSGIMATAETNPAVADADEQDWGKSLGRSSWFWNNN